MKKYIVLCCPRTGSELFFHLLKNNELFTANGLYTPEVFNQQNPNRLKEINYLLGKKYSLEAIIFYMFEKYAFANFRKEIISGFKVMPLHLEQVLQRYNAVNQTHYCHSDFINHLPDNTKIIHLTRKNLMSQTVSLYKARKTNVWAINNLSQQEDVEYSFEGIKEIHQELCEHNKTISDMISSKKHYKLEYENWTTNWETTIKLASSYIGISSSPRFSIKNIPIKIQRNDNSEELRQLFENQLNSTNIEQVKNE